MHQESALLDQTASPNPKTGTSNQTSVRLHTRINNSNSKWDMEKNGIRHSYQVEPRESQTTLRHRHLTNGQVIPSQSDYRGVCEIPTPPPTPVKKTSCSLGNVKETSQFPLFQGLLKEATTADLQPVTSRTCSTPISIVTEQDGRRSAVSVSHSPIKQASGSNLVLSIEIGSDMDEFQFARKREYIARIVADAMSADDIPDDPQQPLSLQAPPPTKLKRQLSVDTADNMNYKRQSTRQTGGNHRRQPWEPYVDEIDGSPPESAFRPITQQSGVPLSTSEAPPSTETSVIPPSPGFVSLKDIGLTSPFTSLTPRKSSAGKESVFVFPESVPAEDKRRPALQRSGPSIPYSSSSSSFRDHDDPQSVKPTSNAANYEFVKTGRSHFEGARNSDDEDDGNKVTHEGFVWPPKVSITQAKPFSPRIVAKPSHLKFPNPATSPSKGSMMSSQSGASSSHDVYRPRTEASYEGRLQAHSQTHLADRFSHNRSPSQLSPQSKEMNNIVRRSAIRSISDVERSPNEKELREIEEDARKKYDRSLSEPTAYNKVRYRHGQQPLSGLVREERRDMHPIARARRDEVFYDADDVQGMRYRPANDRRREALPSDACRRLFDDYQGRHGGPENKDPLSESVAMPRELADLLRQRGIHPDSLMPSVPQEALYADFRRSGSMYDSPSYFSDSQDFNRHPVYERPRTSSYYSGRTEDAGRMTWSPGGHDRGYHGYGGERDYNVRPPASPLRDRGGSDRSRPRYPGEMDVRVTCESITEKTRHVRGILNELDHDDRNCKCSEVENNILKMAQDAFSKIHRANASQEAFTQFQEELQETNQIVYKSLKVLCGIKCLCKHGRSVEEIFTGSVVFRVHSPSLEAAVDLWENFKSGALEKDINKSLVTQELKEKFNADDISLKVSISWEEYKRCKEELGTKTEYSVQGSKSKADNITSPKDRVGSLAAIHIRSKSAPITGSKPTSPSWLTKSPHSPFRDRKFSDSSLEQSPRRVFQEINASSDMTPPTIKNLLDSVFLAGDVSKSPSSPKRKSFGLKLPWEHENLHPDHFDLKPPPSPRRKGQQTGVTWAELRDT